MKAVRLSALDSSFIFGESQRIPLHVGSLTIVEGKPLRDRRGVLDVDRIRKDVSRRLHLVPRLRQKLREIPFDHARPVWVDDLRFRIENHVHVTGLPRPGTRRQLFDLMARLQEVQMNRTRPLWEIWYVDGFQENDAVAVITKIHHCMVDGASGVEIGTLLYDVNPRGTRIDPRPWRPAPEPSGRELLFDAMKETARGTVEACRIAARVIRDPSRPIEKAVRFFRALETVVEDVDRLPFNAKVSSRRRFDAVRIPFQGVREVRTVVDATVNDILLAVVTGALRSYCENRRIRPATVGRVRAIVPVNRRGPGDTDLGSKVSSLFVELPVSVRSVGRRLDLLRRQTQDLKENGMAEGTEVWNHLTSVLPVPLLRVVARLQFRDLMRTGNLLVSNVRGPSQPLYISGGRVRELYPYFGVQDYLGLTVVAVTYDDHVQFGVVTDPELTPDADVFVEGIPRAFAEICQWARSRPEGRRTRSSSSGPPASAVG